jgi:hypothetical protein
MSIESLILLSNQSSITEEISYTDKDQGAGYHKKINPDHTGTYEVINFTGSIKLQGTLERYPGEDDWFDIRDTSYVGLASTGFEIINFTGNFVWIRAVYEVLSGEISQIRYNH